MEVSRKLLWNVYAGVIGAVTAIVVNKALKGAWRFTTGGEPPEPNDPHTPTRQALAWTVASTAGVAVATVMVNRLAASSWERAVGEPVPVRKRPSPR